MDLSRVQIGGKLKRAAYQRSHALAGDDAFVRIEVENFLVTNLCLKSRMSVCFVHNDSISCFLNFLWEYVTL